MSELISGKEALIALANGEEVQFCDHMGVWHNAGIHTHAIGLFLNDCYEFRLKPRTANLNGVEVGQLKTSVWCRNYPKEVTLEFKTEDDAHHFYANAMKIFNGV